MKEFILFWLTGKTNIIKGNSISEAFALAGYGGGAINALDFYSEDPEDLKTYKWVQEERTWKKFVG